jgi:predicted SAM-dependent methyltransferase
VKLNLGCGPNLKPDYVNVDLQHRDGVHRWDIFALPVDDGTVEEILAEHLIEHLTNHDVDRFLTECRRVLCDDGKLIVECPDLGALCAAFIDANEYERYVSLNGGWPLAAQIFGHQRGHGVAGILAQTHKSGFTRQRLVDVLVGHRFRVVSFHEPVKPGMNLRIEVAK